MYRSRRRRSIPILSVKGSYYDIGFDIGRTFATLIQNVIKYYVPLNEIYVKYYETSKGKNIYELALETVIKCYPNYVRELQGMADGSKTPFYKLFLIHLDDVLPNSVQQLSKEICKPGCTTVFVNTEKEQLMGHVVDAPKITLNHLFIVKGLVTESYPHENFTALCCAGFLPGSIMGFNSYGLAYTVNHIYVKNLNHNGVPRSFITRALLNADSPQSVNTILRCSGFGLADALSVNFAFLKKKGAEKLYNIEASPPYQAKSESAIDTVILKDKFHFHCNRFQRLNIPEVNLISISNMFKEETLSYLPSPENKYDLNNVLGNMSHNAYKIFTDFSEKVITIAVAVFDLNSKTLTIYLDNPRTTEPCIVVSLDKITNTLKL